MVDNQLVEMVADAITKSCELLAQKGTRITGYSLCTDDNLWTVYHVASTLPLGGPKPYWANPVEWTVVAGNAKPLFARISEYLRTHAQQAAKNGRLEDHVRTAFESLVVGLEQLRPEISQLGVASDLLFLVVSTDPSPKLLKMEIEAAKRLNAPDLFAKWHSALHVRGPSGRTR